MTRRTTIGARLAWTVAVTTVLGLLLFSAISAVVVWLQEDAEQAAGVPIEEDPIEEAVAQVGVAFAVATPITIVGVVLLTRWIAGRTTRRIDAVIAIAATMTADNLRGRLPDRPGGDEIDELSRGLNALFVRVERAIEAQRQFAADASHELRTPLAVVMGDLEIARRRARSPGEWERIADDALDELRQMTDMVEALLASARAGAFEISTSLHDVDELVDGVIGRWNAQATQAEVRIEMAERAAVTARIDPRAMAIAIGNLVANAIAHSPRAGVVRVGASARDGRIEIVVDDEGPGVRREDRERIFAPFARAESPADRSSGRPGLGLGLAIARRIVEAHGGTLVVGDAPLAGARFSIRLPA